MKFGLAATLKVSHEIEKHRTFVLFETHESRRCLSPNLNVA